MMALQNSSLAEARYGRAQAKKHMRGSHKSDEGPELTGRLIANRRIEGCAGEKASSANHRGRENLRRR
jgi:hypothetical protein